MTKVLVAFTREIDPDFVSGQIMRYLNTNFSHVFFVVADDIYHAVGEGVCKQSLHDYLKTHEMVHCFEVPINVTEEVFITWLEGRAGVEYSNTQYLGFLSDFAKTFVRNGDAKEICSELVAKGLNKYGVCSTPFKFVDCDFVSPKDVFTELSVRGF